MNQKANRIFFVAIMVAVIISCEFNRPSEGSLKAGLHIRNTVEAEIETTPTPQTKRDDSADDPGHEGSAHGIPSEAGSSTTRA